jgi:WbqC-like protein family
MNEIQYFGSVNLYSTLINSKHIYFSPELEYKKTHHPNRTWVYGSNGLISLSIPLLGGRNQKVLFQEVQIAEDGKWRRIHWRSIHNSYRKSPWFEEMGWQVEALYNEPQQFLFNWNMIAMKIVLKLLRLKIDILSQTDDFNIKTQQSIIDTNPVIKLPEDYPVYQQVFMERFGFAGNLSILDLLFCTGPDAVNYLHSLAAYNKNSL